MATENHLYRIDCLCCYWELRGRRTLYAFVSQQLRDTMLISHRRCCSRPHFGARCLNRSDSSAAANPDCHTQLNDGGQELMNSINQVRLVAEHFCWLSRRRQTESIHYCVSAGCGSGFSLRRRPQYIAQTGFLAPGSTSGKSYEALHAKCAQVSSMRSSCMTH